MRQGSETPRIWTRSLRPLTPETSAGFSVIALAAMLGIWLYPWQRWLLIHLLELIDLPGGRQRFRFRTAVVIVGRQNGKSTVAMVLMLWFIYVKAFPLALGTSLDLESAESVWQAAVDLAEEHPDLAAEIDKIVQTNGKKSLVLESKSEYRVKSPRGGRGKAAEAVLIDELLMHKDWSGWAALTKTTLSKDEALVVCFSTAGYADSVVLSHLRRIAHLALGDPDGAYAAEQSAIEAIDVDDIDDDAPELEADDHALFEWSAKPGSDRWDRDSWAQACPSMNIERPDGTIALPERNIASDARKADPTFPTEVQGIWGTGLKEGPFPDGTWDAGTDVDSTIADDAEVSYCVDVSWDRSMTYIGTAGAREDGVPHVELAAMRAGTAWVEAWFTAVAAEQATEEDPLQVVVQAKGAPASSLIDALNTIENLEVVEWGGTNLGIACGQLYDLVKVSGVVKPDREQGEDFEPYRRGVAHLPQPALDVAAGTAAMKPMGDSWVWNRAASIYDAAPLVAVTGALWHHLQRPPPPDTSAYEDDDYPLMFV